MAINEKSGIDQYVRRQLESLGLDYDEQGSRQPEVAKALQGASKSAKGTGLGKPEYTFIVHGHLVIIEDKKDNNRLESIATDGAIDVAYPAREQYAVNGAVHYARHIVGKTSSYKEVIAVGVTGNSHNYRIQPYLVTAGGERRLPELKSLSSFSPDAVEEYFDVVINGETPYAEREALALKRVAVDLHEDLRNYGQLEGHKKATVVSAILLALENSAFSMETLHGQKDPSDGELIYNAVESYLRQRGVDPQAKLGVMLDQFRFLKNDVKLNTVNSTLAMTPLRYYAGILRDKVLNHIKGRTEHDILGNFYGEFVRYGGSDGNALGIVLTPPHITSFMAELIDVLPSDTVFDPCCGTGAFLISAMNRMVELTGNDQEEINTIRRERLLGCEIQDQLFTVATANMILRDDGKANLQRDDVLGPNMDYIKGRGVNKVLMNPPYSQAEDERTAHLAEFVFVKRALEMTEIGGKVAAILPQSILSGKSKWDRELKAEILRDHSLDAVLTMNGDTFRGVGVHPAIAIFTARRPHPNSKKVTFVDFRDDGYKILKHRGLVADGTERNKRDHLLSVLRGEEDDSTAFVVRAEVRAEDEWIHGYFYFSEEPVMEHDLRAVAATFLAYRTKMSLEGKGGTFDDSQFAVDHEDLGGVPDLHELTWKPFKLEELGVTATRGKRLTKKAQVPGRTPYVSSSAQNNGVDNYIGNTVKVRRYSNCLTLANSGSVGATFYHPYEFVASDHVTALYADGWNAYHYLFLAASLSHVGKRYTFNREITDPRIARETVMCPVTVEGRPDFLVMQKLAKKALFEVESLRPTPLTATRWRGTWGSAEGSVDSGVHAARATPSA